MRKLIQDVLDPRERERRQHQADMQARRLDTLTLIRELHRRSTSVTEIYGRYYEIEAMADAHGEQLFGNDEDGLHGGLTVEDARLAGVLHSELPKQPKERQPF